MFGASAHYRNVGQTSSQIVVKVPRDPQTFLLDQLFRLSASRLLAVPPPASLTECRCQRQTRCQYAAQPEPRIPPQRGIGNDPERSFFPGSVHRIEDMNQKLLPARRQREEHHRTIWSGLWDDAGGGCGARDVCAETFNFYAAWKGFWMKFSRTSNEHDNS